MTATLIAAVDSDSLFGPPTCTFCGLANHLPDGGDHPCCVFARRAGHTRCEGCTNYVARLEEGRA